jgi:hypothetical protein
MPAKKSAEKIPFLVSQVLGPRRALCVAGWGMRAAQWSVRRQARSEGARKATRLRGIKLLRKSKRRGRERKLVQCGPEALLAR